MVEQQKNSTKGSPDRSKRGELRRAEARPVPSEAALAIARMASKRVDGRATTIRHGFIRLPWEPEHTPDLPPPLARMMHGSRGGALRIRLYLALLWLAGGGRDERHSVNFPARAFAELLDLPDPGGRGERRVREAFKVFQRDALIVVEPQAGRPSVIHLLQEDASDQQYSRPGIHMERAKDAGEKADPAHLFVQLPAGFWTQGWAVVLNGPAIAMLLVLLVVTENGRKKNQWVSPTQRARYGLSDDTWTRGIAELVKHGVVEVRKMPVSRDFEWKRVRNTYSVNVGRLGDSPASPPTRDEAAAPRRRARRPTARRTRRSRTSAAQSPREARGGRP
jgi:hypothetical protein